MSDAALPHQSVYARLGASRIEGVGVFAIVDIAAGTHLFPHDRAAIVWVDRSVLDDPALSKAARDLYEAFGVVRGDKIGAPASFDLLTAGWYLNEPPRGQVANVTMTNDLECFAARDIAAGEELTVVYATFSESR